MLKPEKTDATETTNLNPNNMDDLERQFDTAITVARQTRKWPALVRNMRDMASVAEIEATAQKYRDLGWVVLTFPTVHTRATITHQDLDTPSK